MIALSVALGCIVCPHERVDHITKRQTVFTHRRARSRCYHIFSRWRFQAHPVQEVKDHVPSKSKLKSHATLARSFGGQSPRIRHRGINTHDSGLLAGSLDHAPDGYQVTQVRSDASEPAHGSTTQLLLFSSSHLTYLHRLNAP